MALKERSTGVIPVKTLTAQVNDDDFTASTDGATYDVTLTRVDTADAATSTGGSTGTYTASDNPLTTAAAILTMVEDAFTQLVPSYTTGITVVVNASTAAAFDVTYGGDAAGYNIDQVFTGDANFATTASETTEGGSLYATDYIPVGKFAEVKRLMVNDLNDASVDLALQDAVASGSTTDIVAGQFFTKTALDVGSAYDKQLATAVAYEASDGATTGVAGHLVEGPVRVVLTASRPDLEPVVRIVVEEGTNIRKRSSGTLLGDGATSQTSTFNLGREYVKVKRIRFSSADASPDTSVAVTLVDAEGFTLFSATIDLTADDDRMIASDAVDTVAGALVNAGDLVAKSPVTLTATSTLGSGKTMKCEVWSEV